LKEHLVQLINYVGIKTKPQETPVDVVKETFNRTDWQGNPYTQTNTTIKLKENENNVLT
jgi:hypothetical protein